MRQILIVKNNSLLINNLPAEFENKEVDVDISVIENSRYKKSFYQKDFFEIIKRGGDCSYIKNPSLWQKNQRKERKIF